MPFRPPGSAKGVLVPGDRICAVTEHQLRSRRPLPSGNGREVERQGELHLTRWQGTAVMGVINATPDSFSDGGSFGDSRQAIDRGLLMVEQGALFLDVGGESTRPGAEPVPAAVEAERVLPVISALARECRALISVDTCKPEVARQALAAGAHLVNDVTGLRDPAMTEVCSEAGAPVAIVHMQGEPRTMQRSPSYSDVVAEVRGFLLKAEQRALAAGVPDTLLDPGIGFGKTLEHNLSLLRALPQLSSGGRKLLVGASRKRTIETIAGPSRPEERDPGSIAIHLHAASAGAALVRVHDVLGHVQALRVWERIHG